MMTLVHFLLSIWIIPKITTASFFKDFIDPYGNLPPVYSPSGYMLCKGKMTEGVPGAKYSSYSSPFGQRSTTSGITSSARVNDIDVSMFLNTDGNPALRIAFEAESPDSPQRYKVDVMGYNPYPLLTGLIRTPRPDSQGFEVDQDFKLDMRCPSDQLQIGQDISVIVMPHGGKAAKTTFQVPGCDHRIMRNSNQCKELREQEIRFSLRQEGNATVVVLVTRSAYQNGNNQVYLRLRLRRDGYFYGWKAIGEPTILTYPERTTRFDDLTPGDTYSVEAWRAGEFVRTSKSITIKKDIKRRRGYRREKQRYGNNGNAKRFNQARSERLSTYS